ncbi:hypothetical protein B0H12DRAFT_1133965 [Mycena haematopus]|nr:hypothetical protein B0H12DRAFT_1133965 [Mycena haematopus]
MRTRVSRHTPVPSSSSKRRDENRRIFTVAERGVGHHARRKGESEHTNNTRKADCALQVFDKTNTSSWAKPNSITYGAVIGACARVGNVQNASRICLRK